METSAICRACHKALPVCAPDGLCPECLLKAGLGTKVEIATESRPKSPEEISPAPAPEVIGRHFPQLQVLELLGQGGMAVVYKARQPHLNRFVALKILATRKQQDPAFAERFTREAQMLAGLNHPSIVTLHDYGNVDGFFYLLMEYVDGVSLRQLMQTKALPSEQALAIVPKICEALQYAHEHGVVHRDIKPENVLLTREGRVKIADFGVAKMIHGELKQPAITRAEQIIGTPHYMAPEQIERPDRVDHRADIFSLGVVFYEMLTGELPLGRFPAPSRKVRVDLRLDEIVLRALEKEPERRYQHASQVRTDIEGLGTRNELRVPDYALAERAHTNRDASGRAGGWGCIVSVVVLLILGFLPMVLPEPEVVFAPLFGFCLLFGVPLLFILAFFGGRDGELRTDRSHWHPALPPPHRRHHSHHSSRREHFYREGSDEEHSHYGQS